MSQVLLLPSLLTSQHPNWDYGNFGTELQWLMAWRYGQAFTLLANTAKFLCLTVENTDGHHTAHVAKAGFGFCDIFWGDDTGSMGLRG